MIFSREFFFYPHKIYSFIYTRLFENMKARILKSIITWPVMGQQNAQAKKVYSPICVIFVPIRRYAVIFFQIHADYSNECPIIVQGRIQEFFKGELYTIVVTFNAKNNFIQLFFRKNKKKITKKFCPKGGLQPHHPSPGSASVVKYIALFSLTLLVTIVIA